MATTDVPGSNPANGDQLRMGAWAESADGSLVLVEGTEGGVVTFSLFDPSVTPILEYRDRMPEKGFRDLFADPTSDKWTWHDKTPFDWDRVAKMGIQPGPRPASAEGQLSAAQRLAQRLQLQARSLTSQEIESRAERSGSLSPEAIQRAIQSMEQLVTALRGLAG